jgi:HEAT repeat protein/energy-coupling factor transporter ATP-binding protein EcfA2
MESANTTPEHKKEFLNQVANEYGFFQRTREVFLARFSEENAGSKNTGIANYLGMPYQEFQDYLGEICEKLGFRSNGKGRSRKGESPWEKAFTWLWNEKFIDASKLEPPTANSQPEQKLLIHRQVCQGMLAEKRRLTTNPLTTGDGTTFERGDVYVPLGLVERKRQAKRSNDASPEEGSKLYEPTEYEVTRRFEHDEFFEQVLRQGLSPKSKGKRIAIIGEPGAGKTTLLQQIADWVFEDTEQDVAIWVSLADLQGRTLEEYLLNVWLKDALKRARVTPEMEDSLVELFNRGRVWLLLDGVDEMTVGAYGNAPLQAIAKQLTTGWVSSARVVLTCRLNVWDASKNALERFDTYRTLEFSYGDGKKPDSDQVNQLISKWFEPTDPQLGKALRTALDQRGKERIKDLVKNPLRLALMCYSWQRRQGELPKTKATLYQRFVEVFYEWKQEYFPTTSATRQELNEALGKLAVEAIAQSSSRFRLTRRFLCEVLGEPDAPMFQLAIQLGWLNQVGVAAENPYEPVYAFYHPTFQEYFAALAIDDWHCFLNHVPGNPDLGIYQVFEPQWKEVILLWLGREDVPTQDKEEFVNALVEFDDGCEEFYLNRAYLLAAAGIAEFKDYSKSKQIVQLLVTHSFGFFSKEKQEWVRFGFPIAQAAREVLKETDREKVIATLLELIPTTKDEFARGGAAESLGQIDPGNQTAINVLVQLAKTSPDESIRGRAAESLGQIDPGNQTEINTLIQLVQTTQDEYIRGRAAESLGYIDPGNPIAINALVQLVQTTQDEALRGQAAESLGYIDPGNETAINALTQLAKTSQDESTRLLATFGLGCIAGESESALTPMAEFLQNLWSESTVLREGSQIVWEVAPSSETAIAALVESIQTTEDESTLLQAAFTLGIIDPPNKIAITALRRLIQATQDESTLLQAAFTLGKIDPGNETAITALARLIQTSHDEYTRAVAVENLGQIGTGNETAITALLQVLQNTHDEIIHWQVAENLGKTGTGIETLTAPLFQLMQSSMNEMIRSNAVFSLAQILQMEQFPRVVTALKDYLTDQVYENDLYFFEYCYETIWYCAQLMPFSDFYHAWHDESFSVLDK